MEKNHYVKQSKISGKGIFAKKNLRRGDLIFELNCPIIKKTIRSEKGSRKFENWIGIGEGLWLNPNPTEFRYLNHSCDPSAAIVESSRFIALRDVNKDEEITFDYSLTDADKHWKMECSCGSTNCRGTIYPIFNLPKEVFASHYPHVPEYFQHVFIKNHVIKREEEDKYIIGKGGGNHPKHKLGTKRKSLE